MKDSPKPNRQGWELPPPGLPLPTLHYRHRAWIIFQRALDPLAWPKPLPPTRAKRRRRSG